MLVEGGCLVDGKVFEQGEKWDGDECTICTCQVPIYFKLLVHLSVTAAFEKFWIYFVILKVFQLAVSILFCLENLELSVNICKLMVKSLVFRVILPALSLLMLIKDL